MKTKILMTLAFMIFAAISAFAQAGGEKSKVAIIDSAALRDEVHELKAKYDKLQAEFAPKARDLESMQNSLANKQKVAQENTSLTPQQAQKLNEEITELKKEYNRALQDSQEQADKRMKEETEAIYEKISKFMDQYCAKHGITHVFDARRLQETNVVVYVSLPGANITKDFVDEYNKANPVQTAANPAK